MNHLRPTVFGKLPAFGDFVRYNADGPLTRMLENWLHQAVALTKAYLADQWEDIFLNQPQFNFYFSDPTSDKDVSGIITPSQDIHGRCFPLVVCSEKTQLKLSYQYYHLMPLLANSLYKELRQLSDFLRHENAPFDLDKRLEQLPLPDNRQVGVVESHYSNFLSQTTLDEFSINLWGRIEPDVQSAIFHNLLNIFLPLKDQGLNQVSLALRFPLSGDSENAGLEIALWRDIVSKFWPVSRQLSMLFWQQADFISAPCMLLFLQIPDFRSFLYLIGDLKEDDQLCVLDEYNGDLDWPLSEQFDALLHTPNVRLTDILTEVERHMDINSFPKLVSSHFKP